MGQEILKISRHLRRVRRETGQLVFVAQRFRCKNSSSKRELCALTLRRKSEPVDSRQLAKNDSAIAANGGTPENLLSYVIGTAPLLDRRSAVSIDGSESSRF